jgi:hypothetical protein
MNVQVEFDCEGRIAVGPLSSATAARLAALGGEWLEYSPEEAAIVVRHVEPGGSPAPAAVAAELIALLDALAPRERASGGGGALAVRDRGSRALLLRLQVSGGSIGVEWPQEDWTHAVPVATQEVFGAIPAVSARVSGRVEFAAPPPSEKRLEAFVDGFEGLYPEGELDLTRDGDTVRAEFCNVNVGPEQLLRRLRELAMPADSLRGELAISAFGRDAVDRHFRLVLRGGEVEASRPALWRNE